jgi:hypothetical protein
MSNRNFSKRVDKSRDATPRRQTVMNSRRQGRAAPRDSRLALALVVVALAPFLLVGSACADGGEAAFSMSIEEFRDLSSTDQKALLVSVFEHRLEHAANIYYEALELIDLVERDAESGKLGKVTERLNGSRLRHWVRGSSSRMDTIRGGPDVAEALETVAVGLDAKSGVVRTSVHFKEGRPPSGRIGTQHDRINDSNFYAYWLDGKHTTENDFLPRYLVEHRAEFSIAMPAGESTVRLTVPWYYNSSTKPWGTRAFDLDPQKGFLPVRGTARWEHKLGSNPQWRVDEFTVEASQLVGDVWMPTKLTWIIDTPNGKPGVCNVHHISISQIEAGTVRDEALEVSFEPGMLIVDAIEGVAYTPGPNGERTRVQTLVGGAGLPPAPTKGTLGMGKQATRLILINLGVLLVAVIACAWRIVKRGRRENPI